MLRRDNKGFTILEMMVIVILIGLIGIAAIPSVGLVRKQEVKKMAKEICLDLSTQRMQAITTGQTGYSLKLVSTAESAYYFSYETATPPPTETEGVQQIKQNTDNSKNIQIVMKAQYDSERTSEGVNEIQFDNYGYMLNTKEPAEKIQQLTITITYSEATIKVTFDGVTGHYSMA